MDPESFRRYGHRVVDWVADYMRDVERYPVLPDTKPGAVRAKLPDRAPEKGEPMERILADFDEIIMPAVTHWNHPRFFAYFPANHSGPAILGELLAAGLGVNGMVWQSCPAATELEEVVMDWLRRMLGLPESFRGTIQDTASTATLCALLCAREKTTGFEINRRGPSAWAEAGPLRVYASGEAHSSIEKGLKIAGFGRENLVKIAVGAARGMDPSDLDARITADLSAGRRPCAIVATAGTTSSTASDPLRAAGEIAARRGLWLHVDAALAGSAAILPEKRALFDGADLCHSFVFNPHKWLFTNFDCSAFFCREPETLERTLTIMPEYLKTSRDAEATNFRDWGIQLGRRFRAIKLWFVLRSFGVEGLQAMLRAHLALAQDFASWVAASPDFELMAPVPLQTVCFRFNPRKGAKEDAAGAAAAPAPDLDALNQALMDAVNRSGRLFLTHTRLEGRLCLRLSIGQIQTKRIHVEQAWEALREAASRLQ